MDYILECLDCTHVMAASPTEVERWVDLQCGNCRQKSGLQPLRDDDGTPMRAREPPGGDGGPSNRPFAPAR